MTQSKRTSPVGTLNFRSFLPDFFDTDQFSLDHLLKKTEVPTVNISEADKTYEVELAVPGLHKEDFKITSKNGMLTISAERKENGEEKKKNYMRREHNFHSFSRTFTLPQDAKEDGIKTHYENGMLKLTISKNADAIAHSKHIEVA